MMRFELLTTVLILFSLAGTGRSQSGDNLDEIGRTMYEDFLEQRYGTDEKPLPADILRKNCLDDLDNYVSRWIRNPTRLNLMELVTQRLI